MDSELTFFTFGHRLIDEILNPDSDLNTTASANIPGGGTTFLKREDMEKKRWGYLVKNFIVDIKAQGDYFFLATEGENGLFHVLKTDANYLGKIDAEDCQIGSFEILDSDIYYVGRHNSHVNLYKLENWVSSL